MGGVSKLHFKERTWRSCCSRLEDTLRTDALPTRFPLAYPRHGIYHTARNHLLIFDPPLPQQLSESHSVVSDSLQSHGLYSLWNSPGQKTGGEISTNFYPFSRGASQPRNRTGLSWIAGRFFTSWATREALHNSMSYLIGVTGSLV